MEPYLFEIKARIKQEKDRYDYESCLDLLEIIRSDINQLRWDARYIGRNNLHRNINYITRREYWTGCKELREFIKANNVLIYGNYVSQTYNDGVPSYYPTVSKL